MAVANIDDVEVRPAVARIRIDILGRAQVLPSGGYAAERFEALRLTDRRFFALLALSPGLVVPHRDLLVLLWPERGYQELFAPEDLDEQHDGPRGKVLEDGLADLRNSASRVRSFLKAAGESVENPITVARSDPNRPASGAYRLSAPPSIVVDAIEFGALLMNGTDEDRLAALRLIRPGSVLSPDSHPAALYLRSRVRRRVADVARVLLPGACDTVRDRVVQDIVTDGDMTPLETARLGSRRSRSPVGDHAERGRSDLENELLPRIESSSLSEVAHSTFKDLVVSWSGGASVAAPAENVVSAMLPARWGDVAPMRLNFLLYAPEGASVPEPHPADGTACLRHRLSRREAQQLLEYVQTSPAPRAYCVLAVPERRDATAIRLLDEPPANRFKFYGLDAVQYFQGTSEEDLLFPAQNVLNLALFSLIWAGRWVEDFYEPLRESPVTSNRPMSDLVRLVFNPNPPLELIKQRGWGPLVHDLPRMRGEFDKDLFRKVHFRLGMGSAMQLINKQILDARGSLTAIRTYCPEALYGTVNLWLFSRSYHQFMTVTRAVARTRPTFVNQRLLPILTDLDLAPRMVAASLWHVLLYYRMFEAQVRIVQAPAEAGGEDHGFYGAEMRGSRWIQLTEDGADWVPHQGAPGSDHQAFLDGAADNTIAGPDTTAQGFAAIGRIKPASQLDLERLSPRMLLPREDEFIEHPSLLWSPGVVAARNHTTR